MTLTSLPEWLAFRRTSGATPKRLDAEAVFKVCTAAHFDDLISLAETGTTDEQRCAFMVVDHFLWAKQDPRWNSDRRDRLVRISRKLVVETYPQDPGFLAIETLRMLDFSWAAEFLGLFPLERVPEDRQTGFIVQLDSPPAEQTRVQLERVVQCGWHDDYRAKNALKRPLTPAPPGDEWDYNPHTQVSGPLLASPEWEHLTKSQNPWIESRLWVDSVTEADVAALVAAWEHDDPPAIHDHRCSGHVLRELALRNNPLLAPHRERIVRRAESLASAAFAASGFIPLAYFVLRELDRERAVDFVLASIDQEGLSARHQNSLLGEMGGLGGPRILAKLQELAAGTGPLAQNAANFLEANAPVTPEKIAATAKRWREKRDAKDLQWLYFRRIEQIRSGEPVDLILQLLGAPTKRGERFCSWESAGSPISLYFETDRDGNLDWMKLYE